MCVIADGDSSVMATMRQAVSCGIFVNKIECANHACKAYRSPLAAPAKDNPEYHGKGGLTKKAIQRLHRAEHTTPIRRQFVAPAEKIEAYSIQFRQSCKYRSTTPVANLVKSLLYSKTFSTEATRLGSTHEDEAKQRYLDYLKTAGHASTSVKDSGLVIDPKDPCSPDGLVDIPGVAGSIMEIKCRYKAAKEGCGSKQSLNS